MPRRRWRDVAALQEVGRRVLRVPRCATVQYAGPGAPISTAVCVLVPYKPLAQKTSPQVRKTLTKNLKINLDMQLSTQLARQLYVSRCRRPVLVPVMYVRQELRARGSHHHHPC